jgi:hypothetical protein
LAKEIVMEKNRTNLLWLLLVLALLLLFGRFFAFMRGISLIIAVLVAAAVLVWHNSKSKGGSEGGAPD